MVLSNEALLVRALNIKCTKHDGSDAERSVILLEENKGHRFELNNVNPQIILVTTGALEIEDQEKKITAGEGKCFLIPPGRRTMLSFLDDGMAIQFNLQLDSQSCIHTTLAGLSGNHMPEEFPFYLLEMNAALQIFQAGIIPFLKAKLCCECYLQAETSKLFHILMGFYHRYEIEMFFSPIICEDIRFRSLILSEIDNSTTVTQLHQLTVPDMHTAKFRAKFQTIFGTNPHEYITNHKKKVIHSQIITSDESFKVIAFDNGFSSQQVFIEFCKRHFGLPPRELRKAYQSNLGGLPITNSELKLANP